MGKPEEMSGKDTQQTTGYRRKLQVLGGFKMRGFCHSMLPASQKIIN